MTGNIPFGGFKITGLGAGTTNGDSVRYEQVVGTYLPLAGGTMVGNLLFTDATYDIGASGATRPRDLFLSRNAVIGGTINVTGHTTFEGVTSTGATGTGKIVYDTGPTLGAVTATSLAGAAIATQAQVNAGTSAINVITPSVRKISILATQATTSGTSKDFTIPSGAGQITVHFVGVSTNGSSVLLIQLGDAGGIEATGYLGSGSGTSAGAADAALYTTGFGLQSTNASTRILHGSAILSLVDSATFTWVIQANLGDSSAAVVFFSGGSKSLSQELSTVRVTTVNGSDAFDAGLVGCSYIL